ncbi:HEAT repeat domain-containing protein [Nocardiopsis dassonvillei]|uniref:HEAT repeat domain-containing protein n=1 Tax=Nocardiopsis dassonvillei TaxID=2014 RepID=UPI00200D79FF|nr:HEAT repeat domain-containing protein [Nocardiopsis dassonvillei]MCK9873318.1 HEAT repeat domain-containing protein [Nocardiopsis dassonvillei]
MDDAVLHEPVQDGGYADLDREFGAGTDRDVRVLVARVHRELASRAEYAKVPWGLFHHASGRADDIAGLLARIRSGNPRAAAQALSSLHSSVRHQGDTYAPAALAVPFLLRVAADPSSHHRAEVLQLAAESGRRNHHGDGSRTGLLRTAHPPGYWLFDSSGYPMHWSIQASREALTAEVRIVLELLDDPDTAVRCSACYSLAAVTGEVERTLAALHGRLKVEKVPEVRVSLVLAIAQLDREHHTSWNATAWARGLWSSSDQSAETRLGAALAWLCLTDDPVPDQLLSVLPQVLTSVVVNTMSRVPWMRYVDTDTTGIHRCLTQMLGAHARQVLGENTRDLRDHDPWA